MIIYMSFDGPMVSEIYFKIRQEILAEKPKHKNGSYGVSDVFGNYMIMKYPSLVKELKVQI